MIPLRDDVSIRHVPVTTWALVAANVLVFLFELQLSPTSLQALTYLFGIVPARFSHPSWAVHVGLPIHEYWPFLTSMFLHAGWLHLIGNMWFLWLFGARVEERMGSARFGMFYLLCGILAGVIHYLTEPASTLPTVGASGAIAGVLGAYFVLYPRSRMIVLFPVLFLPLLFELPALVFLGLWFMIQLFSGTFALIAVGQVGGIAWWAHVGGFVAGVLLHPLFVLAERKLERQSGEVGLPGIWRPTERGHHERDGYVLDLHHADRSATGSATTAVTVLTSPVAAAHRATTGHPRDLPGPPSGDDEPARISPLSLHRYRRLGAGDPRNSHDRP